MPVTQSPGQGLNPVCRSTLQNRKAQRSENKESGGQQVQGGVSQSSSRVAGGEGRIYGSSDTRGSNLSGALGAGGHRQNSRVHRSTPQTSSGHGTRCGDGKRLFGGPTCPASYWALPPPQLLPYSFSSLSSHRQVLPSSHHPGPPRSLLINCPALGLIHIHHISQHSSSKTHLLFKMRLLSPSFTV